MVPGDSDQQRKTDGGLETDFVFALPSPARDSEGATELETGKKTEPKGATHTFDVSYAGLCHFQIRFLIRQGHFVTYKDTC